MKLKKWQTLSSRTVLDLSPWFSIEKDTVRLPSGRVVNDYYRITAPDYVLISARREDGCILMERHYKQCLGRTILTSPAGGVDAGEAPLEAAKRELLEETGFEALQWTAMGSFIVDGTRGFSTAHLFTAEKLRKIADPTICDMEEFELVFMNISEIRDAVINGEIALLPDVTILSVALGGLFFSGTKDITP